MTKREEIFKSFKEKSCVKQDVHLKTKDAFVLMKEVLQEIATDYKAFFGYGR